MTIMGFSIVTFMTGLLPTWQTVGISAPILLVILRFIQGLFAVGEWASGSVITMETVPKQVRGLFSGFILGGYSFGFVIASIVYGLMLDIFPGYAFIDIGWRILFFTALVPGLIALILRVKMTESKIWIESKKEQHILSSSDIKKEVLNSPLNNFLADKIQRRRIFLALIIDRTNVFSLYFHRFYACIFGKFCKDK